MPAAQHEYPPPIVISPRPLNLPTPLQQKLTQHFQRIIRPASESDSSIIVKSPRVHIIVYICNVLLNRQPLHPLQQHPRDLLIQIPSGRRTM